VVILNKAMPAAVSDVLSETGFTGALALSAGLLSLIVQVSKPKLMFLLFHIPRLHGIVISL
jgi:uncharacterized YccA/Bax inhibitor family protein